MKKIVLFFLIALSCEEKEELSMVVSENTASKEIKGSDINALEQLEKPYVILISIDGFRYDYAERYGANNLLAFDVKAEKMIPSFPSKTFPNHYAIVSGLYPGHNGLVSNEFYDRNLRITYTIGNKNVVENPLFYSGTPLWVLAAEQEMLSASMFWVGSEAPIKWKNPSYHFKYDGGINHKDRVNQAVKWLQLTEEKRPHFITLYFSMIDDLGHEYGPESKEIAKGVKDIDKTIGDLISKVNQLNLPVNIIIVSDHGMLQVDRKNIIYLEDIIPKKIKVTSSFPAMIYSNDSDSINSLFNSLSKDTSMYSVYKKSNLPDWYHYDKHSNRIGDLVIMPKPPFTFGYKNDTISNGSSTHGYDPKFAPEMGAIFYAKGPAFVKNSRISPFENVHVYPLIAKILGLTYEPDSIDGNINVLLPILK